MEVVRKTKILNSEGAKEKNEFKQDRQNAALNRWAEKKTRGQLPREMPRQLTIKTWEWTRKGDLKVETEALIFAAQEQPLRTNYVTFNINKSVDSALCRLCGQKGETINNIISECKCLVQKEYKRKHDNVTSLVRRKLYCRFCKYELNRSVTILLRPEDLTLLLLRKRVTRQFLWILQKG